MRRMMRRTGLVSRRGAVVMLAVALAAAACFGGIRLVRLLQHRAAAQAAASVRASATAAVADDVDVCDIVPAGTIESGELNLWHVVRPRVKMDKWESLEAPLKQIKYNTGYIES